MRGERGANTMSDQRDQQVAFAVSPLNDEGVHRMFFVVPDGCWSLMRNYISQDFDLTKLGVPIQAVMTRCPTRHQGVAMLAARGLVTAEDPAFSAKRADKVIWGFDHPKLGRDTLVILMMIPDLARAGMMERGLVHTADLRKLGMPITIEVSAKRNFADCMAYLHAHIGDARVRDVTAVDLTFPRGPGQTTH